MTGATALAAAMRPLAAAAKAALPLDLRGKDGQLQRLPSLDVASNQEFLTEVRTWVQRIGTKSFTLYEEIWQGGRVCTRGTATYVYFDFEAQQSRAVPESVRAALGEHLYEST